jgi:dihydroorotate dehydrogenase
MIYSILRDLLFKFPPEDVHHFSMKALHQICSTSIGSQILQRQFAVSDPRLEKNAFGLHFTNPVGLGAGFDKNASYLKELACLGFGFVEIGTVTPRAQDGNEQPRLFRLPKDKGLINRMGFNNLGVEQAKQRLIEWNNTKTDKIGGKMIVGGNIGKNKLTPNDAAWRDYEICFRELFDTVDYFVVNVSSPNTPGLRELQEKDSLTKILANLQNINQGIANPKPLLLKIAPDLAEEQLADIVSLSFDTKLSGLVATNTTISRTNLLTATADVIAMGAGGLSGKPVTTRATEVVNYLYKNTHGQIPIIASGGIFTGPDAQEKLDAGASLIQVWTGFIYEGPAIVKNICTYLTAH